MKSKRKQTQPQPLGKPLLADAKVGDLVRREKSISWDTILSINYVLPNTGKKNHPIFCSDGMPYNLDGNPAVLGFRSIVEWKSVETPFAIGDIREDEKTGIDAWKNCK